MTPNIRPFLQRTIDEHPQQWAANTYESCMDILQLTLRQAGQDWQFVGKTPDMDGRSEQPYGFRPFSVELSRPDGQRQTVRIVGCSHDAAWHVPSARQVKVIVNSAANSDPRPEIHGPALIGGDVIPVEHYRWHNPPVPQIGGVTPNPPQPPNPTTMPTYEALGGDEGAKQITRQLERDYRKAGRAGLDGECGGWLRRTDYDFLSGKVPTLQSSVTKHRDEWLLALGLIAIESGLMSHTATCRICGRAVGYEKGKPMPAIQHTTACLE